MKGLATAFILVIFILASVIRGSVSSMAETKEQRNARRSANGILLMSFVVLAALSYMTYGEYVKSMRQFIY